MVLFKIRADKVRTYVKDCRMWAREAKKQKGFIGCRTLFRTNEKDQYASLYQWRSEAAHKRFMGRHHDRLVALSRCPVKVLGYYNFETH